MPLVNHSQDETEIALFQPHFQRIVRENGYLLSMEKGLRNIMLSHPRYLHRLEIESAIQKGKFMTCFIFRR